MEAVAVEVEAAVEAEAAEAAAVAVEEVAEAEAVEEAAKTRGRPRSSSSCRSCS